MNAQENDVALPLRSYTILGVCQALGEDFGFNPVFLRIPLAASVIASPTFAFGAYFLLGIAVLVSRLLAPAPTAVETGEAVETVETVEAGSAAAEPSVPELAKAA